MRKFLLSFPLCIAILAVAITAYSFENTTDNVAADIKSNHSTLFAKFSTKGDINITGSTVFQDNNFSGRGNDNEEILRIQLTTTGNNPSSFGNLVMNLNGTTDINDIEEIKIYTTGTSTQFDPRNPINEFTQLLATANPEEGEIVIPLNEDIIPGNNNIWVTFKVKETAKEGNRLDAEVISISTATETHTFDNGNPNGSREIMLARKLIYAPGDYGSTNYRIPAITTASDGSLVVLTDKRKNNANDLPADIDIVANRSTDGGKTWSEPILVAQGSPSGGFGDAAIIKSNSGKLVALFVGGNGLWDSNPNNLIRTYMSTSDDNGLTWTSPTDITPQIYGPECDDPVRQQWLGLFFGSGHALCTQNGRLMAVVAVREPGISGLHNYAVYSDDDGETWQVSQRAIISGDEAKVVELNNSDILMSSRTTGNRLWAKSSDGGVTWGPKNSWSEIWGNACDADIIRYTSTQDGYDKDRILHTLPNNNNRRNVTMWISYDEGTTWPIKKTIAPNQSAYSSITILPDGTIGVYLEEDETVPYKMYFLNFSLNWLTNGADSLTEAGTEIVVQPEISLESGSYDPPQTITLSSATEGASVYYTLDGSVPNKNSLLYTEPIILENSATLKAIAVKEGMANSLMSTASYTIGYSIPIEYRPVGPDRYVTKITTEEGQTNIDYTSLTPPPSHYIYHNATAVTAKRGNSFNLNLTALPDQSDGLQWCQAIILVDWNQDYDFADAGERIAIIGKRKANNSATVLNISQNITVPATAELGKTRIRVVYTDAWRPTNYADLGADPVDKGRIYDLDLIVESGTSVNEVSISQLRVFPNPAKDFVNIFLPKSGKYTISLNTLEGKTIDIKIIRIEQEGDYRLNLDSLSTSTMILNIKHESGLEKSLKLIRDTK
ncbi:MAG TPA: exo-alpha-sialidase [Salinivirgaceae bacterium]|nr:exo-alpha-sialidase [Salinivirgaceae bacterium]